MKKQDEDNTHKKKKETNKHTRGKLGKRQVRQQISKQAGQANTVIDDRHNEQASSIDQILGLADLDALTSAASVSCCTNVGNSATTLSQARRPSTSWCTILGTASSCTSAHKNINLQVLRSWAGCLVMPKIACCTQYISLYFVVPVRVSASSSRAHAASQWPTRRAPRACRSRR